MKRGWSIWAIALTAVAGLAEEAAPPAAPVTEASCVLIQITQRIGEDLAGHELPLIHNEDMMLSAAVSVLLKDVSMVPPDKRPELASTLSQIGPAVAKLHAAADAGDLRQSHAEWESVKETYTHLEALYGEEFLRPANRLAARYTCAMHSEVIGKKGDLCPKCGMPLDQMMRPSLFRPGSVLQPARTIRATVVPQTPLQVGQKCQATLRLRTLIGNSPVLPADLLETHTRKIHLLIVDSSLTDYHHEHPEPTGTPGSYSFSFTPQKPGSYRIWADLRPALSGFQEYAITDLISPVPGEPLTDRAVKLQAEAEGLRYDLTFATPPQAGRACAGNLRITSLDGAPFLGLEPVMAAFAHLIGFSEDNQTLLHMHPKGAPVTDPSARGGPDLPFQFYSEPPGFVRLFAQVQIGGTSHFVPFGVQVRP